MKWQDVVCLIQCVEGAYCPSPGTYEASTEGPGTCSPYDANAYKEYGCGGASDQNVCAAGYYCPSVTSRYICPSGHFCREGSTAPTACPAIYTCSEGTSLPNADYALITAVVSISLIVLIVVCAPTIVHNALRHSGTYRNFVALLAASALGRLLCGRRVLRRRRSTVASKARSARALRLPSDRGKDAAAMLHSDGGKDAAAMPASHRRKDAAAMPTSSDRGGDAAASATKWLTASSAVAVAGTHPHSPVHVGATEQRERERSSAAVELLSISDRESKQSCCSTAEDAYADDVRSSLELRLHVQPDAARPAAAAPPTAAGSPPMMEDEKSASSADLDSGIYVGIHTYTHTYIRKKRVLRDGWWCVWFGPLISCSALLV